MNNRYKVNDNGENSLFNACRNRNKAIVKHLVEHGADLNKKVNMVKSPLSLAYLNGNEAILNYIVEHGEDANKVNEIYGSPLNSFLSLHEKK